jgi:ATP-binding cassette subfamily B protein
VISRLTNDVDALDQLVTDGVSTLVQSTLTLVGTAIILFSSTGSSRSRP